MWNKLDPTDRALASLKQQHWTHAEHGDQLEETLMKQFGNNRTKRRLGANRAWIAALAVVLLGGAGFAAAGGVEKIRELIRVQISLDGVTTDAVLEPIDGSALTIEGENGEPIQLVFERDDTGDSTIHTANVTLDSLDPAGKQVTVTLEGPVGVSLTPDADATTDPDAAVLQTNQLRLETTESEPTDAAGYGDDMRADAIMREVRLDALDADELLGDYVRDDGTVDVSLLFSEGQRLVFNEDGSATITIIDEDGTPQSYLFDAEALVDEDGYLVDGDSQATVLRLIGPQPEPRVTIHIGQPPSSDGE